MPDLNPDPLTIVANRILQRYANPARKAYSYLFHVQPEADLALLFPDPAQVITVWGDEGAGLRELTAETALERCKAIREAGANVARLQKMARIVQFTLTAPSDDEVIVQLASRALVYSPKGDRRVTEQWKCSAEGWYSVYTPRELRDENPQF
jgi:hypothetical protein